MKSCFTLICLVLLFTLLSISSAQTNWTKYEGNPILTTGSPGEWDDQLIGQPSVLFDGSIYHMWYAGADAVDNLNKIGYATSEDGINWTKYNNPATTDAPYAESDPVLVPGDARSWDDERVSSPFVMLIDTIYHMWYTGSDVPATNGHHAIGHATSSNGIIWEKDSNNPVLDIGPLGAWDDVWIYGHSIIFDGTNYHMCYNAWGGIDNQLKIGHATSPHPDSSWTKDINNPVLSFQAGKWDYPRMDGPNVLYDGNVFHMWYSAGNTFTWRIGYAFSLDGTSWTKYKDNPIMSGTSGEWDSKTVAFSSVIYDSLTANLKMWYSGSTSDWQGHIGFATAPLSMIFVPQQYATIQGAIDSAKDGNVILVDDGTYYENINYRGKAITLASYYYFDGDTSHISKTIIDGSQPSNPDSGSVVYMVTGEDTTSVLMGFTITGGTGTVETVTPPSGPAFDVRSGAGIYATPEKGATIVWNIIENNHIETANIALGGGIVAGMPNLNSFIIISDNTIRNNSISGEMTYISGGAIFMGSNGRITNNTISSNVCHSVNYGVAGGAIRLLADEANYGPRSCLIENNTITNNLAVSEHNNSFGGGVVSAGIRMVLRNNRILSNIARGDVDYAAGGGVYTGVLINGNHLIENNLFYGNEQDGGFYGGGLGVYGGSPVVRNNIFDSNSASYGGGFFQDNSASSQLVNNTFYKNSAANQGGGIYSRNSTLYVLNTILWHNTAYAGTQIYRTGTSATVQYTIIQGGWNAEDAENRNWILEPLFADAENGDFHLMEGSPGIGWGLDSSIVPKTDFFGNIRPHTIDPNVDMGAIESAYGKTNPVAIDNEADKRATAFALMQNYPNPFNPVTMIHYQLPMNSYVELALYNLLGQKVATLVSQKQPAGNYKVEWDAAKFSSGVYFYRLETDQGFVQSRKLIVLK